MTTYLNVIQQLKHHVIFGFLLKICSVPATYQLLKSTASYVQSLPFS
jgi:hypothetical protein